MTIAEATARYGPSFEHNKRAFAERYGSESQLVQVCDALIRIVRRAAARGEYLPSLMELTHEIHHEIVARPR